MRSHASAWRGDQNRVDVRVIQGYIGSEAVAAPYFLATSARPTRSGHTPSQLGLGMDIDRVGVNAPDPSAAKEGETDQLDYCLPARALAR
jgi:hypothetical protein